MHIHEATKSKLSECDRVLYIHVDHFEPTSNSRDYAVVDTVLQTMIKDIRRSSFNPSLFLKIPATMTLRGDTPEFVPAPHAGMIMAHIKELSDLGCDIHQHIHHERWTHSELTGLEWLEPMSRGLTDDEMLRTFITKSIELYKLYNIPTNDWGFVHGRWALNASDVRTCNITNEINILYNNGCVADFTMPAGRALCNPPISGIYAIKPINQARCYDTGKIIHKGSRLLDNGVPFIMCYPSTNYFYISLDNLILKAGTTSKTYYHSVVADDNEKAPEDPRVIIQEWILCSCVLDRSIIIKTHAHSMRPSFWQDDDGNLINNSPIFNYKQRERMYLLQEMCNENGVDFMYITARDLIDFVRWIDKGEEAKNYVW